MQLFCRHCYKLTAVKFSPNGPHIQATCKQCGNWIKFLNSIEKHKVLVELLKNDDDH